MKDPERLNRIVHAYTLGALGFRQQRAFYWEMSRLIRDEREDAAETARDQVLDELAEIVECLRIAAAEPEEEEEPGRHRSEEATG